MFTLDAKNKSLGRVATEAAVLLRGKNEPDFSPNKIPATIVKITNISKIKLTGNKLNQKKYANYSGYPGGLKYTAMKDLFSKNPEEIFKKAIWGMLPKNKSRKIIIKNLIMER
ncbi:MAG: 50S ribosomal protein L13 [Candidatus Tagabacteria bacterium RIFCSPLOWO2_01_FULL_39_11]|uniref:Large ribosomal subunit protein uL13 n=1 Tax=Candidatus Tagabacteria bacterium RIFCSPLOWO2_01_FULL_39_11 TaxID=1802295 RepID=A0A1G2LQV8_9BACT|nr:MAG: 50S ribosomal protein L13 [Candidatus Tagabacteria bacterium RIFCSPLOWO2_01_FULL_39_11]